MVKLVISKSDRKGKRFKAVFTYDNGKTKTTHFGLKNPKGGTYIDHKDKEIRRRYRARHKKDLDTKDYTRAGYLSYYILWGDETNLKDAIKSYKRRFNLS
tara:strand:- start:318 stop:617 length:300 start_codon:yes stop_codon:yes gene_type:complete